MLCFQATDTELCAYRYLYWTSPEQLRGSKPDPKCDVYSFAIIMFEVLWGVKPFQIEEEFGMIPKGEDRNQPSLRICIHCHIV